mgnify:CR=1 FL=1
MDKIKFEHRVDNNLNSQLKEFVEEMISSVNKNTGNFRFVLLRWSKENPYWCVFAIEYEKDTKFISPIDNAKVIGGHYCIGLSENLHDVLTTIIDSGWKVEVHSYFFCN